MRARSCRSPLVVTLMVAFLGGALLAQGARWADAYDEAKKHIAAGQWALAEQKLLESKKTGPQPAPRVRWYSNILIAYYPDFYLGQVYLMLKRPKEAAFHLELARQQKIDTRNKDFAMLDQFLAQAQKELQATAVAENLTKPLVPDPAPPGRGDPAARGGDAPPPVVNPNIQRFADLMGQAQKAFDQGDFQTALARAKEARGLNVDAASNARAETLLNDAATASTNATNAREANRLAGDVDAALKAQNPTKAKQSLDELIKLVPAHPRRTELTNALAGLNDDITRRDTLTRAERTAMLAYFAGDYQAAFNAVNEVQKVAPQLSPRALLYRACSMAALALQAKTPDQASLDRAKAALGTGIAGNQLARDLQYISPRVRRALGLAGT